MDIILPLNQIPEDLLEYFEPVDPTAPADLFRVPTQPLPEAHFAVWPEELARRIIRFGCPPGGLAYDPFAGSGTTCLVALQEGREFVASELNPEYIALAEKRIARETGWCRTVPLPLEEPA